MINLFILPTLYFMYTPSLWSNTYTIKKCSLSLYTCKLDVLFYNIRIHKFDAPSWHSYVPGATSCLYMVSNYSHCFACLHFKNKMHLKSETIFSVIYEHELTIWFFNPTSIRSGQVMRDICDYKMYN